MLPACNATTVVVVATTSHTSTHLWKISGARISVRPPLRAAIPSIHICITARIICAYENIVFATVLVVFDAAAREAFVVTLLLPWAIGSRRTGTSPGLAQTYLSHATVVATATILLVAHDWVNGGAMRSFTSVETTIPSFAMRITARAVATDQLRPGSRMLAPGTNPVYSNEGRPSH